MSIVPISAPSMQCEEIFNPPSNAHKGEKEVLISIQNITKAFGDAIAVRDLNLNIHKGEIFALLGGSGCGKSTLLRMLSGFEEPTSGHLMLEDEDISKIPPYKRPFNMMFQSYALFPHMSVEKNIAYGLQQDGLAKKDIQAKVEELLAMVHMTDYRNRKPHQLSGGQRQRVALARSLAKQPKLLLLDEPMGALDKKLRTQMQLELVEIIKSVGVTCVMVTHDQEEAMTMADRIGIMNHGSLVQVGAPHDIYEFPNCRYSAEFIGSVNIFEGYVSEEMPGRVIVLSHDIDAPITIDHGITGPGGQSVLVAIRPEKIHLSRAQPTTPYNHTQGVVEEVAYMGGHSVYNVVCSKGLKVQAVSLNALRRDHGFQIGDQVYLYWSEDSGVVLES